MASIATEPNGRRRVLFAAGGKRRTIRLGLVGLKLANEVRQRVESILAAQLAGVSLDADTAAWLGKIGDDLHAKLAGAGLVPPRQTATLGAFAASFISGKGDVTRHAVLNFEQARNALLSFFGADRQLKSISPADCDRFLAWLRERGAEASAAGHLQRCRTMFHAAVRHGLIAVSPFAGIKAPPMTNAARKRFIDRPTIAKVLDACPCEQWRLLVALSRFGGLRCPSEHLRLVWDEMEWVAGRFTVHGKCGDRIVPIFPELRPFLEACRKSAGPVLTLRYPAGSYYRQRFETILRRAGVKQWPRLFHNLRASRETELAAEYPLHVVCTWIGNSESIAHRHYLTVTDADFERASAPGAQSGANPAQIFTETTVATRRNILQFPTQDKDVYGLAPLQSDTGQMFTSPSIHLIGERRPPINPTENMGEGNNPAQIPALPSDLAALAAALAALPPSELAALLALVKRPAA